MRRYTEIAARIGGVAVILVFAVVAFTGSAFAQFTSTGGQSQGSQAAPLPLSGRTGQSGGVTATQSPVPGTTTSVNTLNPTVQESGAFAGSANSTAKLPFSGKLSLSEAVQRGLAYNLGAVGMTEAVRQAQAQSKIARSALLPNLSGNLSETVQQTDLAALGVRFSAPIPGFSLPTIVGPFNYFDLRATLSQSVLDVTAMNNRRSANASSRASQLSAQDAQDLIVLAVGGAYLQVIAAQARVQAARAQLDTANALYQQTLQQLTNGKVPQIDVNRSQVEALTQQQRLVSLQNDVAKQKINLARLAGLPPNDQYEITDEVPFTAAPAISLEDALQRAFAQRADLKAAETQVQAADHALSAARAERLPSLSVSANYGVIGTNPSESHGTFSGVATLHFPIWQGGRTGGDVEQAEAALAQRKAELEDVKSQVESDVRNASLDLQAATSQVQVSQQNLQLAQQTLDQTRQRFDAGMSNNVEVVQTQESVASAQLDYINSVFAHNVAKLSLARAMGRASDSLPQFLKLQ